MSSETDMGVYPENHPIETSPVMGNSSLAHGFRILMWEHMKSPESSGRHDETCHVRMVEGGGGGQEKHTEHGCMKQEDPPE